MKRGRKPIHPKLRKQRMNIRQKQWVVDAMDKLGKEHGELIEAALIEYYGFTPPKF